MKVLGIVMIVIGLALLVVVAIYWHKINKEENMYICDACGCECNQTTNIMVVLNLCNSCVRKYYSGELFKKENSKKDEDDLKE